MNTFRVCVCVCLCVCVSVCLFPKKRTEKVFDN